MQTVTIVGTTDVRTEIHHITEAGQLVFGPADELTAIELYDRVVEAVRPAPFRLQETRGRFSWGAAGPDTQSIIIAIGLGVGSGLTVEAIVAGLKKLFKSKGQAGETVTTDHPFTDYRALPTSAEIAWNLFADFLETAFHVTRLRAIDIEATQDGWTLRASGDAYFYEGAITGDGRIAYARRV